MKKFTPIYLLTIFFTFLLYQGAFCQGVAINTTGTAPSVMLHVTGENAANNSTLEILRIDRSTTHASNGTTNIGGAINFRDENASGALTLAAGISARFDVATAGSEEGTLIFLYGKNNVLTEGMRVDGTSGFVGINSTVPQARLTVVEENLADNTTLEVLRIQRINATASTGGAANIGVSQTFFLESSTDQTFVKGGSIDVILEDATSGSQDGSMQFMVAVNGTTTEYMRVDGTFGFVGIGTTAPASNLNVASNPASNSTILQLLTITRQTTNVGNGANGIGSQVAFELEDNGGGLENAATIDVQYEDATNGSEKATISFGIKQAGSITELLRLDGTDQNVGIGQSSPTAKLHVFGSDDGNNTMPMLRLERLKKTGNGAANNGGAIQYFLEDDAGNSETMVSLDAVLDVATNAGNAEEATLRFLTKIGGSAAVAEQMRIDGTSGYIGMGATSPSSKLHITQDDNTNTVLQILTLERNKTTGGGDVGLGSQIAFLLEDAVDLEEHADIEARLITATNNSEDAAIEFRVTTDGTNDKLLMGVIGDQGGAVTFFGGVEYPLRTVTGNGVSTTLDRSDYCIIGNATGASDVTVNLPAAGATNLTGHVYVIKRANGGGAGQDVIIDPNAAETIDGAATLSLTSQYAAVMIISDGTSWHIFPK